jgi:hypothetical protein
MDSSPPPNPYHPDDPALAAFAGREAAFARLHQHLTSPTHAEAVLFLGRRHVGKTALLRHFGAFFDDTFIDVYLPLQQTPLESEERWLLHLVQGIGKALALRDFTLTRLPEPPEASSQLREWFADSYLDELFGVIRYRRLALLLDDADALLNALGQALPTDHLVYLQALVQRYPQFGIALTLDTAHETAIPALSPLIHAAETFRLTNLSQQESRWLLQKPAAGLYAVPDDSADTIYKATGGQPLLLQRAGRRLFERWEAQQHLSQGSTHNADLFADVKGIIQQVYAESEAGFRETWQQATRDERLVLTAIVSLLYDDPLSKIDTTRIESWLVETDYPLDATAINAALRSLEYNEIVSSTSNGLAITAGLMQTWLLEHARLTDSPLHTAKQQPDWRWAVVVAILVVIGLLVAISFASGGSPEASGTPLPTVTLAGGE